MRQSKKGRLPHSSPFLVPAPLMVVFTSAMLVLAGAEADADADTSANPSVILRSIDPSSNTPGALSLAGSLPLPRRTFASFHRGPQFVYLLYGAIGTDTTTRKGCLAFPPAFIRHPCIRAVRSPESTTPLNYVARRRPRRLAFASSVSETCLFMSI